MSSQLLEEAGNVQWAQLNQELRRCFWKSSQSAFTPITNSDHDLYQSFFRLDKRVACYGNSCTYITQACRGIGLGLGLKYHDRDLLLSIGSYKSHYVVVRPLGRLDWRFIQVLDALHYASGKPVFIKKLFPDQVARLHELGDFKEAIQYTKDNDHPEKGSYPWRSHQSFADDDTFPEIVLDISLTLDYKKAPKKWFSEFATHHESDSEIVEELFRYYLKFRAKVTKFATSDIKCRLEDYNPDVAESIRRFLLGHFGEKDEENVEAYENMMTKLPLASHGDSFFSFVAYLQHRPLPQGFFVAERLDGKSGGLYAAIASRCCPGLSEYLHVQMLSRLRRNGIRFLNIGGSEVKSLHEFKLKFAPIEQRRMRMLVYGALGR
jgi:hypothetical protein